MFNIRQIVVRIFFLSAININKYIYICSIIVYSQITILWTRNNNTYNTSKMAAKHVTIFRLISALCNFKPFISHNQIYRNRKKHFFGCLGCRIMTPIDKTPLYAVFFDIYTIFYWPSIQRCDSERFVHNDVTSPYYRKHSAVSGMFSENLKFILFLRSLINYC